MTKLTRRVVRHVDTPWRNLVVILHPGEPATVELRPKHARKGYSITLASLYVILASRHAAQVKHEKAQARKAKKGGTK